MNDPVGVTEIADRAGVKPDTVQKWRTRHDSFPPPAVALSMGPIWDWHVVAEWLDARHRTVC